MSYSSTVLADSPLAYYRLGEASGTTMTDASGNSRHGAYVGTPGLGAASLIATDAANTAVDFPGTGASYGEVAYASWMALDYITLEAVIQLDAGGKYQSIIDRDNLSVARLFQFRISSSNKFEVIIWTATGGPYTVTGTTTLAVGTTYHVAATYDGTTIRVFVNGVQEASFAATGVLAKGTNVLDIGINRANGGGAAVQPFDGKIDEVAVYGSALSATRLRAHYVAAVTSAAYATAVLTDAPAVYHPLAETAGTVMTDTSGAALDGSYVNGAVVNDSTDAASPIPLGKHVRLDGADDHLLLAAPATEWFTPAANGVTLEGWFYVRFWSNWMRYFDFGNAADTTDITVGSNNGGNGMFLGINGVNYNWVGRPSVGAWHHIVVTITAAGAFNVYVDGTNVFSGTSSALVARSRSRKYVGRSQYADPYLAASVTQVAVYNSVLSGTRVTAHYNAGVDTSLQTATVAFSGGGSVAASGLQIQTATAGETGSGTLTALARQTQIATAALTGEGTLTATGGSVQFGDVQLGGSGQLVATDAEITLAGVPLGSEGTLEVDGQVIPVARAQLGSQGTLQVSGDTVMRGGVRRWVFYDPATRDAWQVPINPNQMNSPFVARNIQMAHGTHAGPQRIRAIDLPATSPATWTFSGVIRAKEHHDALRSWAKKNRVIRITDHLGRTFEVIVASFNPTDRTPTPTVPWRGNFDMSCLVLREIR